MNPMTQRGASALGTTNGVARDRRKSGLPRNHAHIPAGERLWHLTMSYATHTTALLLLILAVECAVLAR